jgi:secondary thiamine-phosphate synthase enzyme
MIRALAIEVKARGLHEITAEVSAVVKASGVAEGLCTLFLQHTSASLLIQENADPAARRDLERWFNRLVPEGDDLYTHTEEGADDMPAHIKAALTAVSLSIPVAGGALGLGRWQGIFLWEHRRFASQRHLLIHLSG